MRRYEDKPAYRLLLQSVFNKGINAVIGENNNGKTALIDAIRIAFSCVLYKKDIFFSKTDFHVNAAGERAAFAQIDVYLKDVPQNLIEIWDPIQPDCGEFHVVFTLEKTAAGTDKVKYRAWGGKCEGNRSQNFLFSPLAEMASETKM